MTKVITHNGRAHLDDFLSSCLTIYKDPSVDKIERRDPTIEEIENPNMWILDIGRVLNPKKKKVDHHLRGMDNDCTLSLLLKHWGLWDKATEVHGWIKVAVLMDTGGYKNVYDKMGISSDMFFYLHSFIEGCMLFEFQEKSEINKGEPLFSQMYRFGKRFFEQITEYQEISDIVNGNTKFKYIKGVPVIKCLEARPSKILSRIIAAKKKKLWGVGGIAILQNDREPQGSITLKKFDNDARVDFRRLSEDHEKVSFVHDNGFMAVICDVMDYEIDELLKLVIRDDE